MPQILKSHSLAHMIGPVEASLNAKDRILSYQHVRDLDQIANLVVNGYEILSNAEFLYSDVHHFKEYIFPRNYLPNHIGRDVLEEKKYPNKSRFLKDFYKGDGPIY